MCIYKTRRHHKSTQDRVEKEVSPVGEEWENGWKRWETKKREEDAWSRQQWRGSTLTRLRTMAERQALSKRCQLSTEDRFEGWQSVETRSARYKRRPERRATRTVNRRKPLDRFACRHSAGENCLFEVGICIREARWGGTTRATQYLYGWNHRGLWMMIILVRKTDRFARMRLEHVLYLLRNYFDNAKRVISTKE